jgi:hypothetical protein
VHYVTYLLELTEGQVVSKSVAYGPDPETVPRNGFEWKVVCDAEGRVLVRGMHDSHLHTIASARWRDGLDERRQIAEDLPNDHQWAMIATSLREELARVDAMDSKQPARAVPVANAVLADSELEGLVHEPDRVSSARAAEIDERLAARRREGKLQAEPGPRRTKRKRDLPIDPRPINPVQAEVNRKFRQAMWILAASTIGPTLIVLAIVFLPRACKSDQVPPVASPEPPRPVLAVDAAVPLTIDQRVAAAATLPEALALAQPLSTTLLARYAVAKLKLAEVDAAETTLPLVEKDYRSELGKRVCITGEVRRIERADLDGRKVFVGELLAEGDDRVTYLAVGSTGELVKRTRARFCGVVTGKLELVGMFDLPENRAPIVEQ